jgi:hypothetical protein
MIEAEGSASFELRCGLSMNVGADTGLGIGNSPAHPPVNPILQSERGSASVGRQLTGASPMSIR